LNIFCGRITGIDLPLIRRWRNENRKAFFDNKYIGKDKHDKWFSAYLDDPYNHMYIVCVNNNPIGCFGIKLVGDNWEVYNVIRGEEGYRGCMGLMLRSVIESMNYPVSAKVLKGNDAIRFYLRNGFYVDEIKKDHIRLRFGSRP
jgi:hypothetical protein